MIRKPVLALACGLGILAILLVGCSKSKPTNPTTTGALDLTSQFGGYTATDEPVAFGDPEIAALMGQDSSVTDPSFTQAEGDSLRNLSGATVYAMAIRWGMLKIDPQSLNRPIGPARSCSDMVSSTSCAPSNSRGHKTVSGGRT